MPIIAIALLIAAALGGGVSAAAQSSLPGDALWGFKTTVNENVQGAFAAGDEAKANWDISVASARLDEAQKLAAQGKLNAQAQADITANLDEHAQDVADRIAKLQADGKASTAAQLAARFQAALANRSSAVAQASAGLKADAQAEVEPFLAGVRGTLDAAANLSADATVQAEHEDATSSDSENDGSDDSGASVQVNTGTSVRGAGSGQTSGGIHTDSETGATVGI